MKVSKEDERFINELLDKSYDDLATHHRKKLNSKKNSFERYQSNYDLRNTTNNYTIDRKYDRIEMYDKFDGYATNYTLPSRSNNYSIDRAEEFKDKLLNEISLLNSKVFHLENKLFSQEAENFVSAGKKAITHSTQDKVEKTQKDDKTEKKSKSKEKTTKKSGTSKTKTTTSTGKGQRTGTSIGKGPNKVTSTEKGNATKTTSNSKKTSGKSKEKSTKEKTDKLQKVEEKTEKLPNESNQTEIVNAKVDLLVGRNKYLQEQLDIHKNENYMLQAKLQFLEMKTADGEKFKLRLKQLEEDYDILKTKYDKSESLRSAQENSLRNLQLELERIKKSAEELDNIKKSISKEK